MKRVILNIKEVYIDKRDFKNFLLTIKKENSLENFEIRSLWEVERDYLKHWCIF